MKLPAEKLEALSKIGITNYSSIENVLAKLPVFIKTSKGDYRMVIDSIYSVKNVKGELVPITKYRMWYGLNGSLDEVIAFSTCFSFKTAIMSLLSELLIKHYI